MAFALGVGLAESPEGDPIGDNAVESELGGGLQHGFGTDGGDRLDGEEDEVQLGFDVVEMLFVGDVGDGEGFKGGMGGDWGDRVGHWGDFGET